MHKLEKFIYACLPALLIFVFSEVAVFLADGKGLTMALLGVFYLVLVWWLYQYTSGKSVIIVENPCNDCEDEDKDPEQE